MSNQEETHGRRRWSLSDADLTLPMSSTTLDVRALLAQSRYHDLLSTDREDIQQGLLATVHDYPRWVGPTLQQLNAIINLREDWDSYGAREIVFESLEYAFQLLEFTMEYDSPAPKVIPTSRGGVQLEWHERGIDLEIEVLSPYRVYVSYENLDNIEDNWEDEAMFDLTRIWDAIRELSRRAAAV